MGTSATQLAGLRDSMASEEDFTKALQDMVSVEASYQKAINGEPDGGSGEEEEEEEEDGGDQQLNDGADGTGHHAAVDIVNSMDWVDSFILNT
jgi:hypothetical protein